MKRFLILALSLIVTITFAQQTKSPLQKPGTLIEFTESGLPAPEHLPGPLFSPEGSRLSLTFYNDRANFDADYPGLPVEGFESSTIANGLIGALPHPLDASSSNAYFVPGDILPGIQFWGTNTHAGDELAILGANYVGNPSKTIVANYFLDDFRILFNPPVFATGMDIQDFMGNGWCTVEIYDAEGSMLGGAVTAASETGVFWGIGSDEPIGEIRILSQGDGAEGADNIAFGGMTVPLSNYALIIGLLMIIAVAVIRYRRIM